MAIRTGPGNWQEFMPRDADIEGADFHYEIVPQNWEKYTKTGKNGAHDLCS